MIQQLPYRKRLLVGDIFVMQFPDNRYLFGRIMKLDASFGGFKNGCIKTHIYDYISNTPIPPVELTTKSLLIPPQWINKLGFSRGYLSVVANVPLSNHNFQDTACYNNGVGKYLTEDGIELNKPTELIGFYGLGNYRTLDDKISEAIGIPLIPE